MSSNPPPDSSAQERAQSDAHVAAAWRVAAVAGAWALASALRPDDAAALRLLTDVGLAAGGWWALAPGRRAGGPRFMRADHWTKFLAAPTVLGAVLGLVDVWRLVAAPAA